MKQVSWMNVYNWTHAGGHGSRVHLTNDDSLIGKTLCGKDFPQCKGHPIMIYLCKKCMHKSGMSISQIRELPISPSSVE